MRNCILDFYVHMMFRNYPEIFVPRNNWFCIFSVVNRTFLKKKLLFENSLKFFAITKFNSLFLSLANWSFLKKNLFNELINYLEKIQNVSLSKQIFKIRILSNSKNIKTSMDAF